MGGWRGVVACLSGDNGGENSSFGSQGSQDVTGMAFPASGQGQMECPWCCLPLLLHLVWFLPVQSKPQSLGCFLPPCYLPLYLSLHPFPSLSLSLSLQFLALCSFVFSSSTSHVCSFLFLSSVFPP